MARVGMSDGEMATFIKDTFCANSTYGPLVFAAAELPPSWQTVCAALGLDAARGLALQNALLGACEAAVTAVQQWGRTAAARLVERRCNVHACSIRQESCAQTCPFRRGARQ